MNWAGWLIALLAWLAIGLGVAFLFGLLVRGVESREKMARPPASALLRMYLARREKTLLRKQAKAHSPLSGDTATRSG